LGDLSIGFRENKIRDLHIAFPVKTFLNYVLPMHDMTDLSIVIPCYNEFENIPLMHKRLTQVLAKLNINYEIIFVDDASTDQSFAAMKKLHEKDPHVKLIQFRKNSKKASAIMAGLRLSSGDKILTMDGDLQDEPNEISNFLNAMQTQKLDLVVGWKHERKDPWHKTIPSKIFNFLVRKLTRIKLHDSDCNFRLMTKELAEQLDVYGGLFRYIPSIAVSMGFKIGEIKVKHNPRMFGVSKWGASRIIKGALDLLTVKFLIDYKNSPLYFFGVLGLVLFGLGFISGLLLIWEKFFLGLAIAGRPLLFLTVLLILLGVQFLFFGLLAELMRADPRRPASYQIKTVLK